jgi:hypothetical protein
MSSQSHQQTEHGCMYAWTRARQYCTGVTTHPTRPTRHRPPAPSASSASPARAAPASARVPAASPAMHPAAGRPAPPEIVWLPPPAAAAAWASIFPSYRYRSHAGSTRHPQPRPHPRRSAWLRRRRRRRRRRSPVAPLRSAATDSARSSGGRSRSAPAPPQRCRKQLVIESRWVSKPPALAGKLRPRRLNR